MTNPLGEDAPTEPVRGGCGSALCVTRAWVVFECADDPGVAPPCERCAAAIATVLAQRQEDRLRVLRSASSVIGGGPF